MNYEEENARREGTIPPSFILREASRASRERNRGHAVPTFDPIRGCCCRECCCRECCWRTRGDATSALQCRFVHLAQNAVTILIVAQSYSARSRYITWMYFYMTNSRLSIARRRIFSFRIYIRKRKICKVYRAVRARAMITSGFESCQDTSWEFE